MIRASDVMVIAQNVLVNRKQEQLREKIAPEENADEWEILELGFPLLYCEQGNRLPTFVER